MNITDDTPTWREALGWFLGEYLPRHRGMSPHTIESYGTALRFFLEKPDGRMDHPCEAGVNEVLRFLEGLEKRRGNASSTRNQRLAALKSFWKAMPLVNPGHRTTGGALQDRGPYFAKGIPGSRAPPVRVQHRLADLGAGARGPSGFS